MELPDYVRGLRQHIGHALLWLPSVTAVVVNDAEEVLLTLRSDTRTWANVSGFLEPGEHPATAIVREVAEETGLKVVPIRLVAVTTQMPMTYPSNDVCQFIDIAFRCHAAAGDIARVNDGESIAVEWFKPDELPEVEDKTVQQIRFAFSGTQSAWFAFDDDAV